MPIQFWHCATSETDVGPLESACEDLLTAEERRRAARFRQITSKNQFVVGRAMTRRLVAHRVGARPETLELKCSPHGKPFVNASHPIQFNVAHTGGLVVCAVTMTHRIGVDVESDGRTVDLNLAERYFAPSETAWLQSQPCARQRTTFMQFWTLKESFIKAVGTGLAMPLDSFAFDLSNPTHPRLTSCDHSYGPPQAWSSYLLEPRPGYIAAVTVNRSQRPVVTALAYEADGQLPCSQALA